MKICQKCGQQLHDDSLFCTSCGTRYEYVAPVQPSQPQSQPQPQATAGMNFDFNTNLATQSSKIIYEYKVLSQKDKWFSGKFDPAVLEKAINAYAQQGWKLVGCATADIGGGFSAGRQEFIAILEREI